MEALALGTLAPKIHPSRLESNRTSIDPSHAINDDERRVVGGLSGENNFVPSDQGF